MSAFAGPRGGRVPRWRRGGYVATLLIVNAAIGWAAVHMYPVKAGSPEEFLGALVGEPRSGRLSFAIRASNSRVYYFSAGIHGNHFYVVAADQVRPLLARLRSDLKARQSPLNRVEVLIRDGEEDLGRLVRACSGGLGERRSDLSLFLRQAEEDWKGIGRYWINLTLEVLLLNGVLLLFWFPLLKTGVSPATWAVMWGGVTSSLFFPYYLGYCSTEGAEAGPDGGVVYPWLIYGVNEVVSPEFLRALWTGFDYTVKDHLPQVLAGATQTAVGLNSLTAVVPSPIMTLAIALMIGCAVYLWQVKRRRVHSPV